MKIKAEKLNQYAAERGATPETLAGAIAKGSKPKQQAEALKKIRNWMDGRNHPAVRASEVAALATALGREAKDLAVFSSTFRWSRSSPRKARLLADLVRGRRVDEALALLEFNPKRASVMVTKALKAAIADAEGADAAVDRLYVSEARVDGGVIIKRFQPKDRGRAHPILKRTSHITIGVEEAN